MRIILERDCDQMTRAISESATNSPNFYSTPAGVRLTLTDLAGSTPDPPFPMLRLPPGSRSLFRVICQTQFRLSKEEDVRSIVRRSLVPTARGLAKPRVARGSYLWTVVGCIRTVVPFLRRVAWPNLESLEERRLFGIQPDHSHKYEPQATRLLAKPRAVGTADCLIQPTTVHKATDLRRRGLVNRAPCWNDCSDSTDHSPQSTSLSGSRFAAKPRREGTALFRFNRPQSTEYELKRLRFGQARRERHDCSNSTDHNLGTDLKRLGRFSQTTP
ncbi:hypothetical protein AVEN_38630-1 [Araneus ventricosus]|uniref:Uncharacterized protein n=1 Tax=Araneus ventricosus TaxID=182803 RepID=A0A4Y2FMN4_ARAVE|nr:hypothetical protein AVEN_38630-1 [Araneus ventricosus]